MTKAACRNILILRVHVQISDLPNEDENWTPPADEGYSSLLRTVMNSLFAIAPYKFQDMWVFDDPGVGLRQEPFVSGADRIIDILTKEIPDATNGFNLVFSPRPFPGSDARFVRGRPEHGGTWYSWPDRGIEGWLCPALFKYFEAAPEELYVKVSPK